MEFSFLPKKILSALLNTNYHNVYEIRLRVNFPVKINVLGVRTTLNDLDNKKVICTEEDLIETIANITENSIYAYNDKILKGFITTNEGTRVGLSGECVVDNGKIVTLKNFTSLNIRFDREVFGCSDAIYNKLYKDELTNLLIVAPPFSGKTTILKDLVRRIDSEKNINILLIDERGEFSMVKGENIDVIKFGSKKDSFLLGVRSLSPDLVVMDELATVDDFINVEYASTCGIKVIATVHGSDKESLIKKHYYKKGLFDKYVFLKGGDKKGVIDKITDMDFNEI